MIFVSVFFAMVLVDFLWARYIQAASNKNATKASIYSVAIILAGAFTTKAYVSDSLMLIPAGLGAFVGTYLSIKMNNGTH